MNGCPTGPSLDQERSTEIVTVVESPGASSPCTGEIANGEVAPRNPSGPLKEYQVIGAPPGFDRVTVADGCVRPRSTVPADNCSDPGVVVVGGLVVVGLVGEVVVAGIVVVGGGGAGAGGWVVVVTGGLAPTVGVVDVVIGSVVVVVVVVLVVDELVVGGIVVVAGIVVVVGGVVETTGGAAATVVVDGAGKVVVVVGEPGVAVAICPSDPSANT